MIGAVLAILVLACQWWYGFIPQNHGWQAIKSIGWPYLILLAALTLISVARAPVNVDRERSANISQLTLENSRCQGIISEQSDQARRLGEEITDLKKPKRSAFEEKNYQAIKSTVEGYEEDEKTVLRHLRRHGKIVNSPFMGLSSLPTGFDNDHTAALLNKLTADHMTTSETHAVPGGWEKVWQIAPGALSALNDLL